MKIEFLVKTHSGKKETWHARSKEDWINLAADIHGQWLLDQGVKDLECLTFDQAVEALVHDYPWYEMKHS